MGLSCKCSLKPIQWEQRKMVTLGLSPAQNPPPKPSLWIMGGSRTLDVHCARRQADLYIYILCVMYMYIIYIYTYIPYISEYFSKRAYSQSSQHVRILGQGHLCSQFPFQWTSGEIGQATYRTGQQSPERPQVIPRHSTFWPIATS